MSNTFIHVDTCHFDDLGNTHFTSYNIGKSLNGYGTSWVVFFRI